MGGSKHKNVTKEKEQKTEKEVQPRSTKAGENSQCLKIAKKSRIQHCERSELRLHFMKNAKTSKFGDFLKT